MCLICKQEKAEFKDIDFSNDIKINEWYDSSDTMKYCTYCGGVFIDRWDLLSNDEKED